MKETSKEYASLSAKKIVDLAGLKEQVEFWKWQKKSIVFTNGCFDLVHIGHADYLERAASLGDKLIVGVNTDASVKRLKGESRPIMDEYSRCRLLAAFGFVDLVILFDEPTPLSLIEMIEPDILAKGADYQVSQVVGADFVMSKGGEVKLIEFIDGYSSTLTINKIKLLD